MKSSTHGMEILFLVTKLYPSGSGETYISHEIDVLARQFDRVVVIPIDCFDKEPNFRDLSHLPNVEIFSVNSVLTKITGWQKIKFQLGSIQMVLNEIIFGNDGWNHVKKFKDCLSYAYLCRIRSCSMVSFIRKRGWANERLYFYNYWMTRTTIASSFAVAELKRHNKFVLNVSRAHSSDLYHKYWNDYIKLTPPPFMPFEYFKLKYSDYVVSISQHGLNHIAKTFPQFRNKIAVSRLGVIDIPTGIQPERSERFEIITCAKIHFNKGMHRMPEILNELRDLPVHWTHIGWGLNPSLDMVLSAIDKYKVSEMVTMLGHMNQTQIEQLYHEKKFDLIVNLSNAEGIPVSIMEAIRYGIPGIVTDTVGNPEIIDSSCGFVIPIDFQSEEVAGLIRRLVTDKDLHKRLSEGARHMYEERYQASKNFTALCESLKGKMSAIQ